jgi:hypothetical protein
MEGVLRQPSNERKKQKVNKNRAPKPDPIFVDSEQSKKSKPEESAGPEKKISKKEALEKRFSKEGKITKKTDQEKIESKVNDEAKKIRENAEKKNDFSEVRKKIQEAEEEYKLLTGSTIDPIVIGKISTGLSNLPQDEADPEFDKGVSEIQELQDSAARAKLTIEVLKKYLETLQEKLEKRFSKEGKIAEEKVQKSIESKSAEATKKIWDKAMKEYKFSEMHKEHEKLKAEYIKLAGSDTLPISIGEINTKLNELPSDVSDPEFDKGFSEIQELQDSAARAKSMAAVLARYLESWPEPAPGLLPAEKAERDKVIQKALKSGFLTVGGKMIDIQNDKDIPIIIDTSSEKFFDKKKGLYTLFGKKGAVQELGQKGLRYTEAKIKEEKEKKEPKDNNQNKKTEKAVEPEMIKLNKEGELAGFYTAAFEYIAQQREEQEKDIEKKYIKIFKDKDLTEKAFETMAAVYEKIEEIKKSIEPGKKDYPTSMATFLNKISSYLNFQFDDLPNEARGIVMPTGYKREKLPDARSAILIGKDLGVDADINKVYLLEKTIADFVYTLCSEEKDGQSVFKDILKSTDEHRATVESQQKGEPVPIRTDDRDRFAKIMKIVESTKELTLKERTQLYNYYEAKLQNFQDKGDFVLRETVEMWLENRNAYCPVGVPKEVIETYYTKSDTERSVSSVEHLVKHQHEMREKYRGMMERYRGAPCFPDIQRMYDSFSPLIENITDPDIKSMEGSVGTVYVQYRNPDGRFSVEKKKVKKIEMMNEDGGFLLEIDRQFAAVDRWYQVMQTLRDKKIIQNQSVSDMLERTIPFLQQREILPGEDGKMSAVQNQFVYPDISQVIGFMATYIDNPMEKNRHGIVYDLTEGRSKEVTRQNMRLHSEEHFLANKAKKRDTDIGLATAITNPFRNSRPEYWHECLQYALYLDYRSGKKDFLNKLFSPGISPKLAKVLTNIGPGVAPMNVSYRNDNAPSDESRAVQQGTRQIGLGGDPSNPISDPSTEQRATNNANQGQGNPRVTPNDEPGMQNGSAKKAGNFIKEFLGIGKGEGRQKRA